jgi:hypothetical protein
MAQHRLVQLGEAAGIIAGQSIREPGTQLAERALIVIVIWAFCETCETLCSVAFERGSIVLAIGLFRNLNLKCLHDFV